ncbi:hypothetical protein [Sabulicella rubraurantiaca]|uniref:hypothetical protein n=1 Tax=Sabulicella rubraurantiaca TaxID=2811429 RepID=UPI001A9763D1|nr:hypothetical protein [Sabulicella rubraurantiaca]
MRSLLATALATTMAVAALPAQAQDMRACDGAVRASIIPRMESGHMVYRVRLDIVANDFVPRNVTLHFNPPAPITVDPSGPVLVSRAGPVFHPIGYAPMQAGLPNTSQLLQHLTLSCS